jgi:DNA invertase Pin-like site-specific DNA recombinase
MKTPDLRHDTDQAPIQRTAVYVRMSKKDFHGSTDTQVNAIRNWAALRGMKIVRTHSVEDKREFFH